MALYDIDTGRQAEDLMPPTKRGVKLIALISGLLDATTNYMWQLWRICTVFRTPSPWAPGTYFKYSWVTWNQYVYECTIDGTTTDPSDTTSWKPLNVQLVTTDERQYYTGDLNILQWSLNRWYNTTYRNLPDTPDIYITKQVPELPPFIVGIIEDESSAVGSLDSTGYIGLPVPTSDYVNFTINVPATFFATLGDNDAQREYNVRSFVDKYVAAGNSYKVKTY